MEQLERLADLTHMESVLPACNEQQEVFAEVGFSMGYTATHMFCLYIPTKVSK